MLLFGIDMESKIALGALAGFFPIAINTAAGVRQLNPVYARVGASFGLTRRQMATKILLPALERSMITGMRLGLGVTIVGVLLAEIKLSNRGLGFLANNHYNNYRIAQLYALLIAIFALAALLNSALGAAPSAVRAILRRA
jgi:ABC-type nitrate/sulfonate/bicarbonate transport system permease component